MARKQPELTAQTKQNLMDAYWMLYTADFPGRITVKMITDKAGYNRGTFYAYFLDIEDLHSQIEDELLPVEEDFQKLREATFAKNGRQIVELLMQHDEVSGEKLRFLLGPRGSLSFQSKLKETLNGLIKKYMSLDLDEPESMIDYKSNILCAILLETIRYWYDRGNSLFPREKMISHMLEVIFFGLKTGEMKGE